jgi:hypothetical protein
MAVRRRAGTAPRDAQPPQYAAHAVMMVRRCSTSFDRR